MSEEKKNPFRKGTKSYEDFETMSDLQYHCSKCELKIEQGGKTFNTWKNEKGIKMKEPIKQRCPKCGNETIFRAIESLDFSDKTKKRKSIGKKTRERIIKVLSSKDSITGELLTDGIEIDHRIPQVRWTKDEDDIKSLTDEQIKEKFQLLTRTENLTKSRSCEKCCETGKRSSNPYWSGKVFYEGTEDYDSKIGCSGCFWYNPKKWFEHLKEEIKKENK